MTDEQNRPTAARDLAHSADAPLLECLIADAEHFIDEEDLRLEERGNCESQPHVHAARVPLDRRVDEAFHLGEPDDVVELCPDLATPHSEDRTVQEDVLSTGQLWMKAGSDLEQRTDTPRDYRAPARRFRDPRHHLQESRLSGAVTSDHADDLAFFDFERHVVQRPELTRRGLDTLTRPSTQADVRRASVMSSVSLL